MAKFSIIIPMYNSEKYISKCIESVLLQSYENFELILVNDGSTDNTYNICQEYLLKDNRIILLDKKNGGVSSARNMGIRKSSGNYIIFIDSDDHIEQNLLYELNQANLNENYDLILHTINSNVFNDVLKKNVLNNGYLEIDYVEIKEVMPTFIKKRYINPPWNKMYKSSIIKNNRIFFNEDLSLSEDALFNYQYFSNISNLLILNKNLYNYYIDNPNSLTHTYNKDKYRMMIYANNELMSLVKSNGRFYKCQGAANYIRLKAIYSSLFDLINNDRVTEFEKNHLYNEIFRTNQRFNIDEIDEFTFKILAIIVNSKNKSLLKLSSKLVYLFNKIINR